MSLTYGYVRVSTTKQEIKTQKYEILDYCQKCQLKIDKFFEVKVSSRKSTKERKIDELINTLNNNDILIVYELSRLGRSMIETLKIIEQLIAKNIHLIFIKQPFLNTNQNSSVQKLLFAIFSAFAETERDYISTRVKSGLVRAKLEGKKIGRPKGRGKSILDRFEKEIKKLISLGVTKTAISQKYKVSHQTLYNYLKKVI